MGARPEGSDQADTDEGGGHTPRWHQLRRYAEGASTQQERDHLAGLIQRDPELAELVEAMSRPGGPLQRAVFTAFERHAGSSAQAPVGAAPPWATPSSSGRGRWVRSTPRWAAVALCAGLALLLWIKPGSERVGPDVAPATHSAFARSVPVRGEVVEVYRTDQPRPLNPKFEPGFEALTVLAILNGQVLPIEDGSCRAPCDDLQLISGSDPGVQFLLLVYTQQPVDPHELATTLTRELGREAALPTLPRERRQEQLTRAITSLEMAARFELSAPYKEVP